MLQIKALRKQNNITMKQLGEIIGVAESTISLYENGKRQADYETLKIIAKFFNVSTDYLLGIYCNASEMALARSITKSWLISTDINIDKIENKIGVSYHTLRSWSDGYGDYFDKKLSLIADLIGCSVDFFTRSYKNNKKY